MSKSQILFSIEDHHGLGSTNDANISAHIEKYGKDNGEVNRHYAQGKTYRKLYALQSHVGTKELSDYLEITPYE